MQTKDKKLPFQIIHRFINFVRLTHRSESARESSNIMFSDDELVIISHLETAATDLRRANPELIEQAKKILSESSFVSVSDSKQYLLSCIELLLIEAKARQENPALYDFLFNEGELWYFHNRDKLPNELVQEIQHYLTFGNPYLSPEEEQKQDKLFEEVIAYSAEKRPSSVDEFIREKIQQMPDYERNDFLSSKSVKHWIEKWHAEYCKIKKRVSMHSFQNRVSQLRKELKKEVVD